MKLYNKISSSISTNQLIRLGMFTVAFLFVMLLMSGTSFAADSCPSLSKLQERYKDCYSCMTMKVLLESFMSIAAVTYDIAKEAGVKLLAIGSILWIAFFTMKNLASFTNPEAPNMLNEVLKFAGKVAIAYVMINAGISVLVGYFVNPILATGADFANTFLSFGLASPAQDAMGLYQYNGPPDIIDPAVLDKILLFTEGISQRVATNMVIGNGLMCFADKVGFHLWRLSIPDIWLWLCGAVIWFIGFLLVMFVSYYLLDIAFKIGFAIMILPVVIGLWPFKPTSGRVALCFSIILKAAATYAFLALTATFAAVLIDEALGGVKELFEKFEKDDVKYVSELFSITGPTFLLFCVCFFYAIKLVGKNQQLVNRFFPDKIFGDVAPIHSAGTTVTDKIKGAAMAPVTLAKDIAVHQTGRAAGGVVKGAMNVVTGNAFKGGQNAVGSAAKGAGSATKMAGNATKTAGSVTKGVGKGLEAAGKGVEATGTAVGGALSAIPVVGTAVGGFVKASTAVAGKAMQGAGKVTQAAGEAAKKTGEGIKQTGEAIKRVGQHVKDQAEEGPQSSKEDKKKKEEENNNG